MKLRCPECCSPLVEIGREGDLETRWCGNCGARFPRGSALVRLDDTGVVWLPRHDREMFALDSRRATAALRDPARGIAAASPHSDADELQALVEAAQAERILGCRIARARIYVFPMSVSEPDALLAVDPGTGSPTLLGGPIERTACADEDPISFTVGLLEEIASAASGLLKSLAADSARLDRIADFLNDPEFRGAGDLCELVAAELVASGRRVEES